jgi:hypothetical protein
VSHTEDEHDHVVVLDLADEAEIAYPVFPKFPEAGTL